jgi:hypothetical protein
MNKLGPGGNLRGCCDSIGNCGYGECEEGGGDDARGGEPAGGEPAVEDAGVGNVCRSGSAR